MWRTKHDDIIEIDDNTYIGYVTPFFPNINDTLEKFTESCHLDRMNELYMKAMFLYKSTDIIIGTTLINLELENYPKKEGFYTVLIRKYEFPKLEEIQEIYKYYLSNYYNENSSVLRNLLKWVYRAYFISNRGKLNISTETFNDLVFNSKLTREDYVENPINEEMNIYEFLLTTFTL